MNPVMLYAVLVGAIVFEVLGTSAMQAAQHFSKLVPTLIMVVCYAIAFYLAILYAAGHSRRDRLCDLEWSRHRADLSVGYLVFGQKLDLAAILGLGLIIAGVVVLNVFSKSTFH